MLSIVTRFYSIILFSYVLVLLLYNSLSTGTFLSMNSWSKWSSYSFDTEFISLVLYRLFFYQCSFAQLDSSFLKPCSEFYSAVFLWHCLEHLRGSKMPLLDLFSQHHFLLEFIDLTMCSLISVSPWWRNTVRFWTFTWFVIMAALLTLGTLAVAGLLDSS